jgi:hypothetical protein
MAGYPVFSYESYPFRVERDRERENSFFHFMLNMFYDRILYSFGTLSEQDRTDYRDNEPQEMNQKNFLIHRIEDEDCDPNRYRDDDYCDGTDMDLPAVFAIIIIDQACRGYQAPALFLGHTKLFRSPNI